ncbi:MAG TPA: hypothetical protein VD968_11755 [Pyrinomonadaceae bacterium]|nr:hypothetical protein [Pyrinomonadaceae bacterium]
MSDYLWEKTGARDAEVERLERLLGAFGHRPRPLELPHDAAAPVPAANAGRRFGAAHMAAAAAVLLAVLAGALAALVAARRGEGGRPTAAATQPATPAREVEQTLPPPPVARNEEPAPAGPRKFEAARRQRRPRVLAARGRGRVVGTAPHVEPDEAAQRLRAKEQLVYALRLTGARLEEVRRRVQGEEGAESLGARGGTR